MTCTEKEEWRSWQISLYEKVIKHAVCQINDFAAVKLLGKVIS